MSGEGTSRERRGMLHGGVVDVTPDKLWSIRIIAWLNNFVLKVFTTKYARNLHQLEQFFLLTSIVTSRIYSERREL